MGKYNGDYNSTINQNIKRQLVQREVLSCETDIVEYILEKSHEDNEAPFSWDDIENLYKKVCPKCKDDLEEIDEDDIIPIHKYKCIHCEENYDTYEEAKMCCEDEETEGEVKEIWFCPFCEDEYDSEEEAKDCICHYNETIYKCIGCKEYVTESDTYEEFMEVYEWWQVTNYFADMLRKYGEVVIADGWHNYWGRCSTGQAIVLDYIISRIANDMEILEGQKYSWANIV